MNILGIGGSNHDYSFCIVQDGIIRTAIEEERLSKEKNSLGIKSQYFQGLDYCLKAADLKIEDIDLIMTQDLFAKRSLPTNDIWSHVVKINHHISHAASAYYTSNFNESALLVVDGGGSLFGHNMCEIYSLGMATGNQLEFFKRQFGTIYKETNFLKSTGLEYAQDEVYLHTDSIGTLYTLMSVVCGFHGNQEGKLMGLAPYGKDIYVKEMSRFINTNLPENINIRLNNDEFKEFLIKVHNSRKNDIFQLRADLAYATQFIFEDVMFKLMNYLYEETKCKNLCFSGGTALNSVMNGKIKKKTPFENINIFAAANDSGTAVGAALYGYYNILKNEWKPHKVESMFLGKQYDEANIKEVLEKHSDVLVSEKLSEDILYKRTAEILSLGKTVGWFQDRAELGPRALGNRSILADCRRADMKDILNHKVKFRESFRPFAPMVLEERVMEYFDTDFPNNPFMLFVSDVKEDKRSVIPAVTHVDGTARLQTISKKSSPKIYKLIEEFEQITGIPVIINTSFNIKGKPIIETPHDAVYCLLKSGLDCIVLHNYLVYKREAE